MVKKGPVSGRVWAAALFTLAAYGAGVWGIELMRASEATAPWWPAAGCGVVALLLLPRRSRGPGAAALFAAYVLANLTGGRSIGVAALLGLSDVAETVLVVALVSRYVGPRLRDLEDVWRLFAATLAGAAVAAAGIAATAAGVLGGDLVATFEATLTSHAASVVLLAPVALIGWQGPRPHLGELGLQVAALAVVSVVAFVPGQSVALGFAPLPLLVWAAARFDVRVVVVEQVAFAVVVNLATRYGWGPFNAEATGTVTTQMAQLYLISLALVGLPLSRALDQRATAMERVGHSEELLLASTVASTAQLQAERDWTRAVIETASSMIVVTTGDGTVIAANRATTDLTGYAEEELTGRPLWSVLVPPEQQESVAAAFSDTAVVPTTGELMLVTRDGGHRVVEYATSTHRDSSDAAAYHVLSATDVTVARENAGLVGHLLSSASTTAFVGTDLEGRITLVNSGAQNMLGLTAEEASGRCFTDFLSPADGGRPGLRGGPSFASVVGHVDGAVPTTGDWTWRPVAGAPLQVSMTTNPVTNTFGQLFGYLFVASDVSDSRRSQQVLVQALQREREAVRRLQDLDRAKDDFVSTVSHELRTPMSSIVGGAELLGDGMLGDLTAEQQRMIDVIGRNGDRLLALADDLLLLASFDQSVWQDQRLPLDLVEVLEESRGALGPRLAGRTLEVSFDLPGTPVPVVGDAVHLERAVTNLLSNAVKFTPDGGQVSVSLRADPDARTAEVTVSDTGLGIPEADLEAVFGRFFRSSVVHEHAIQGSGLGLSIVRTIVEAHDGRIEVRSLEGEGTTFTIRLPLA
jgi:PAS domain S-box-containing protein